MGRGKRRENYILRELVEVEKAGEWDKDQEGWNDDEYTLPH